jgi:hypothetical protein
MAMVKAMDGAAFTVNFARLEILTKPHNASTRLPAREWLAEKADLTNTTPSSTSTNNTFLQP